MKPRISKRPVWVTMLLGAAFAMSGCFTLSIHPIYDVDTVVAIEHISGIVGTWGDPEGPEETWKFERASENTLRLTIREGDSDTEADAEGVFEVHVVRLGGKLFLDLYPEEPEDVNEVFLAHVIPAHSFLKLDLRGDRMALAIMDDTWLKTAIETGQVELAHQKVDGTLVLTEETTKLRKVIAAHVDELFEDEAVMARLN